MTRTAGRPRLLTGEASSTVYRGADGRWHARVTMGRRLDGSRDRRHVTRMSRAEIERAVRTLERERDSGQYAWTEVDTTLGRWLEHWLDNVLPGSVRWKTLSTYHSQLRRHVLPLLGAARLSELRPDTLEDLYRRLAEAGLSAHTVHAVHRVLRSALNEAVRRRRIASNPALIARAPRLPTTEVQPLSREECLQVLGAAEGRRNAARWSVALALGLRQGEALGLQWPDVDLAGGTLRVRNSVQRYIWEHGCWPVGATPAVRRATAAPCGHLRGADCPARRGGGLQLVEPKTRSSRRTVVLPGPLVAELAEQRQAQLAEPDLGGRGRLDLVFSDELGGLIDPARDRREWKALLQDAGVRDVRLHDARHTAATLLLVQGVDVRTTMAIMGWTEMATAQRYSHAVDELRQEAARRMSTVLWV